MSTPTAQDAPSFIEDTSAGEPGETSMVEGDTGAQYDGMEPEASPSADGHHEEGPEEEFDETQVPEEDDLPPEALEDRRSYSPEATDEEALQRQLLELEEFRFAAKADPEEDTTGRAAYKAACDRLDKQTGGFFRFPINSIIDKFDMEALTLDHCGLGDKGAIALAECLKINQSITSLSVSDNWITPRGGDALFAALVHNKSIRKMDFSVNRLGCHSAHMDGTPMGPQISNLLKKNSTVVELILRSNKIGDVDMEHIAEGVVDNTTLAIIDLSYNELGPRGGVALANMIHNSRVLEVNLEWNRLRGQGTMSVLKDGLCENNTITKFNLAWNGIGDEGGEVLGKIIAETSALEELDVSHNRIGVKGAIAIANGLKANTTLSKLVLANNPLKDDGISAILRAIREMRDNSTLQRVDISSTDAGKQATAELQETLQVKRNIEIAIPKTLYDPSSW